MHDVDGVRLELRRAGAGDALLPARVPPVGDVLSLDSQPCAEVFGDRAGDADDRLRGVGDAALEPRIQAVLRAGRPRGMQRLITPSVAKIGDPGGAPWAERQRQQMSRMRRPGRHDAVDCSLVHQAPGRSQRAG